MIQWLLYNFNSDNQTDWSLGVGCRVMLTETWPSRVCVCIQSRISKHCDQDLKANSDAKCFFVARFPFGHSPKMKWVRCGRCGDGLKSRPCSCKLQHAGWLTSVLGKALCHLEKMMETVWGTCPCFRSTAASLPWASPAAWGRSISDGKGMRLVVVCKHDSVSPL